MAFRFLLVDPPGRVMDPASPGDCARLRPRLRGPVPHERLARERARRAGDGAGHLTPFDPVAVWWLDQRLARGAA
jgi:hypothetical protein